MCWAREVDMPLESKAWCYDKIMTLTSYFQNINFYEEYFFQGITTVLTCFMSLLRTRHFNWRPFGTLKVISCSWELTTFRFVTALYELILIDIQLSSHACLIVGGTICLLLGLGNAISTEVSRTECVYCIYDYGDPIPWWNDTAAYTRTSCFFRAHFKKIREKVPQIDFSFLKRKTRMLVWLNKFSAFYQGVSWTDIKCLSTWRLLYLSYKLLQGSCLWNNRSWILDKCFPS